MENQIRGLLTPKSVARAGSEASVPTLRPTDAHHRPPPKSQELATDAMTEASQDTPPPNQGSRHVGAAWPNELTEHND
jgi:hypothetical protein